MADTPVQPVMKRIGRYELLREIGRGGMAAVYLARQIELDRFVAIKELGTFHAADPMVARRFLRESRLASSFTHTNIVTVFDYFEHEGTPYIAMEYIEGGSLRPYVGTMTLAQIGGVLEGTLAGLAHAEERNVVHRDLKPENVMVTVEGRVKIADFGIAKATDRVRGASVLTQTGMTVGTPMYMAPEQAMGQEVGPWTDLYSIGCMAYEFFAGRVPFDDGAPMAILMRHINEPPPPLAAVAPDVDPQIADWVADLLVKDPVRRPASASEAWTRFEEILLGLLGPRWRRQARLHGEEGSNDGGRPLTPAPFKRDPAGPLSASQYDSFDWAVRPGSVPGPATPPPHDAPSGPLESGPIDVPVGAPTPDPIEIVEPEPDAFETFDAAPPPRPPERDLATPPGFHVSADLAPGDEDAPEPGPVAPELPETVMPQRPPAPEPAPPVRRRRTGLVLGGAIATAGALAAVIAIATSGSPERGPVPTPSPAPHGGTIVSAGPVRLQTASGWEPLDEPVEIAGLELANSAAAAPGGDADRGTLIVGTAGATAHRPDLLAPAFVASLGLRDDVTPERTEVKLGRDVPAYRYTDVRPLGLGRSLTVYAAPTSAGVVTLACVQPAGGEDVAARCDDAARSLTLTAGAQPFPLGPSREYGSAVEGAFGTLTAALERDRGRLRSARTPGAQGRAAAAIAGDYRRARATLADVDSVSPADAQSRSRLVTAMRNASSAWRELATAAGRSRRSAYGNTARRARLAERRLAATLTALKRSGYADLIETRYRTAHIPPLRPTRRPDPGPSTPRPTPPGPPRPAPTAAPPRPAPTAAPPRPAPTAAPPRPAPTEPPEEG